MSLYKLGCDYYFSENVNKYGKHIYIECCYINLVVIII